MLNRGYVVVKYGANAVIGLLFSGSEKIGTFLNFIFEVSRFGKERDGRGAYRGGVRRICAAMPGCEEKLSHGEPTFFVRKKVFTMFANNHHNDGHIAGVGSGSSGFAG